MKHTYLQPRVRNVALHISFCLLIAFVLSACNSLNSSRALVFEPSNLPPLANGFHYEGWAIVDNTPISTGKFNVDAEGDLVNLLGQKMSYFLPQENVQEVSSLVITIEPSGDTDDIPADTHILAGDVRSGRAFLGIQHQAALGTNFTGASGSYIFATPTTTANDDELSGVWFLDPSTGTPRASLNLPSLPVGWVYEAWAVINGQALSTGRFRDVASADDFNGFSGPNVGPSFPGEDFISNAPNGLNFPTNLAGQTIVISVEPDADDSSAPFILKPLVATSPSDAVAHQSYGLAQNLEFPSIEAVLLD